MIERLWRSVKYEDVYLKDCQNVREAQNHTHPAQWPDDVFEDAGVPGKSIRFLLLKTYRARQRLAVFSAYPMAQEKRKTGNP